MYDIKSFLADVANEINIAKEELEFLNETHHIYTDFRVQNTFDTIAHLEYIKQIANDPDVLNCHIEDYNNYNVFKASSVNSNSTLGFIAKQADIDKITQSKEMYITTTQLVERFNLPKPTVVQLRNLPYSDEKHLEHYKINNKLILYKWSYIVQYMEQYNKRHTD